MGFLLCKGCRDPQAALVYKCIFWDRCRVNHVLQASLCDQMFLHLQLGTMLVTRVYSGFHMTPHYSKRCSTRKSEQAAQYIECTLQSVQVTFIQSVFSKHTNQNTPRGPSSVRPAALDPLRCTP